MTTVELRPCDGLVKIVTRDDGCAGRFQWWEIEQYASTLPPWLPLVARLGYRWLEAHGAPSRQQIDCIRAAADAWRAA